MPDALPVAYANALPQAVLVTQCTDGRTDGQDGRSGSDSIFPTVSNARRGEPGFATLADVLEAGLWATGERHQVVRTGERAEIPGHVRAAIWYRDRRCRLCPGHDPIQGPWHLDHIIPWSAGGPDTSDNLRVLCEKHNLERSNRIIAEERPESLVTWWCQRCYMGENFAWDYREDLPSCPIHYDWNGHGRAHCRVQRAYLSALERTGEWPAWHQREPLTELHKIAYCAHCNLRGLTGVTL